MTRIHVVGEAAAGKDMASQYIAQKLGVPHVKVSDIVKRLCVQHNTTAESLVDDSRLYQEIQSATVNIQPRWQTSVVNGSREVRFILPSDFVIYVFADWSTRLKRYQEREGEVTAAHLTKKDEHEKQLGFGKVVSRADAFVDNSAGRNLFTQLDNILKWVNNFSASSVINPHYAADLGWVSSIMPNQIQQNGIDLTISHVYELEGQEGFLSCSSKSQTRRQEIRTQSHAYSLNEKSQQGYYKFEPSKAYEVVFNEVVNVPHNVVGLCWQRSTLNRNGVNLFTCVWDSGYRGRGSGTLKTSNVFYIEKGARVAQIVFFKADAAGAYQGSYQNERL